MLRVECSMNFSSRNVAILADSNILRVIRSFFVDSIGFIYFLIVFIMLDMFQFIFRINFLMLLTVSKTVTD